MIQSLARLVLLVLIVSAIAVAVSGPGYRFGWWPLPMAFSLLRWATYIAIGAIALAVVIAIAALGSPVRSGFRAALAAILIGSVTIAGPLTLMARAKGVPPIHDVTTDTANPPQFVAVLLLRANAPNPPTYGGAVVAAQQKQSYPEIAPLDLALPPAEAFSRALAGVRANGWIVVAAVPAEGRIEATATTPFFGFKDDVVLRITSRGGGSRLDMRSVSRIGMSDLGTNARRVGTFLAQMRAGG